MSGDHRGLVSNVVRGEWGFDGVVITDQALSAGLVLAIRAGLGAGTDLWLNSGTDNWQIDGYASNPVRRGNHLPILTFPQSCHERYLLAEVEKWQPGRRLGVDVVAGVAAVAGAWAIVRNMRRAKAKVSDDVDEAGEKNDEAEMFPALTVGALLA